MEAGPLGGLAVRIVYERPGVDVWEVDDRYVPAAGDAIQFGVSSFRVHQVVWFRDAAGVLESVRVVLR